MLLPVFRCLVSAFKTRRELTLENLALRQQLAVIRRSVKRPLCLIIINPLIRRSRRSQKAVFRYGRARRRSVADGYG